MTPKQIDKRQGDLLLSADTGWFHIFHEIINSGDLAKLIKKNKSSISVYLVVKSHIHYKKGVSFPSIATIMEKTGLSNKTVHKALEALEEYGYVDIDRSGRHNVYRVREKIRVKNTETEEEMAVVSFDYFSSVLSEVRNEIKNFLVSPTETDKFQYISIENLNININQQIVKGDNAIQQNISSLTAEQAERIVEWRDEGKSWNEIIKLDKQNQLK